MTKPNAGVLYVVATPIGNLGDITLRAIKVLGEVDLIACEDTRRTATLLTTHGIRKPMVSYFEHNELKRVPDLVERLKQGAAIALVSDAGTPAISDPGYRLVRAALDAGCRVVSVPGPSAMTAALSIAGLPTDRFCFEGFLPTRSAARKKALAALKHEPRTIVFFEAARRLPEVLAEMAEIFGADREAAIVREVSKIYEETIRGTLRDLAATGAQLKGEVTLIVAGAAESEIPASDASGLTVEALREAGMGLKQASDLIAQLTGRSRREVYQEALRKSARTSDPGGPEEE
ncbi:MAG: 16S rRNA (cytidine(1402)-2'-O)-methyltransferase [Candidatus Binataceae bacterium]|jgi:16S rRNA (cytidine1402-2'-O)-methyltransferase